MDVMLAHLPASDRLTIERIIERASAEGYEIENNRGLVSYARKRYVEAAADFGAVDSAMDMINDLDLALPVPPSDEDLTESSVSRSRSGRSDRSFATRSSARIIREEIRISEFAFMSRALRQLESDLNAGHVTFDQIEFPGLKDTKTKFQKAFRKIRKAGTKIRKAMRRGVENVQGSFTGKR